MVSRSIITFLNLGAHIQDLTASRVVVEVVVAEPPLISSSREELAISDSDPPGSPLKIRVSITSSDIIGLKAVLTARNLVCRDRHGWFDIV
jgi:hypothetical protein